MSSFSADKHEVNDEYHLSISPVFYSRVMAVPATVIYFTCYEQLKVAFKYQDSKPSDWWIPMFSGALARGK